MRSLFSQLEPCRVLREVFSRENAFHERCKFHKGDVVLEPTGDGVKPESVCILESGLAAVSLAAAENRNLKKKKKKPVRD